MKWPSLHCRQRISSQKELHNKDNHPHSLLRLKNRCTDVSFYPYIFSDTIQLAVHLSTWGEFVATYLPCQTSKDLIWVTGQTLKHYSPALDMETVIHQ